MVESTGNSADFLRALIDAALEALRQLAGQAPAQDPTPGVVRQAAHDAARAALAGGADPAGFDAAFRLLSNLARQVADQSGLPAAFPTQEALARLATEAEPALCRETRLEIVCEATWCVVGLLTARSELPETRASLVAGVPQHLREAVEAMMRFTVARVLCSAGRAGLIRNYLTLQRTRAEHGLPHQRLDEVLAPEELEALDFTAAEIERLSRTPSERRAAHGRLTRELFDLHGQLVDALRLTFDTLELAGAKEHFARLGIGKEYGAFVRSAVGIFSVQHALLRDLRQGTKLLRHSYALEEAAAAVLDWVPDILRFLHSNEHTRRLFGRRLLIPGTFGIEKLVAASSSHIGRGHATVDDIADYLDFLNEALWGIAGFTLGVVVFRDPRVGLEIAGEVSSKMGKLASVVRTFTAPLFRSFVSRAFYGEARDRLVAEYETLQRAREAHGLERQAFDEVLGARELERLGFTSDEIEEASASRRSSEPSSEEGPDVPVEEPEPEEDDDTLVGDVAKYAWLGWFPPPPPVPLVDEDEDGDGGPGTPRPVGPPAPAPPVGPFPIPAPGVDPGVDPGSDPSGGVTIDPAPRRREGPLPLRGDSVHRAKPRPDALTWDIDVDEGLET